MIIWKNEINDLEKLYESFKGHLPDIVKELELLIKTQDANVAMLYSRRCLEVIITDLCERELKRPRKTEPLKGIIDKLNSEEKVPSHIITSMLSLNSMSTYGTHPKDFDPEQVKPVLINLSIIIKWYLKYKDFKITSKSNAEGEKYESKKQDDSARDTHNQTRRTILVSSLILTCVVIILSLFVFNIIGGGKQAHRELIESVVVLPFSNLTGDAELETIVSGMHTFLITNLQRISGLRVINATTTNVYQNIDKTVREIAVELSVEAAIQVSVHSIGDSIIIQVSLINAFPEEETRWIGDYKEEKSQIINVYNRITKKIAEEVNIGLTIDGEKLLAESRTVDPDAIDAYMKGLAYWEKLTPESIQLALASFQLATDIAPQWADPYAGLANAWGLLGLFGMMPKSVTLPNTYKFLNKALELDPNSAQAQYVKAIKAVWQEWDWEQGEKAFLRSLELNPNDALCHLYYAHLLMILLRSEEAVHQANLGLKLDPLKPLVLVLYGVVMLNEGDDQSAILNFEKALSIDPDFGFAAARLSDIQMQTAYTNGDYEKWIEYWEKKVRASQHWNEEGISAVLNAFHEKGILSAFEEMFKMNEKYGDACYMSGNVKAERYIILKQFDKAIECLEKSFEMHEMDMTYILTNVSSFNQLKDNPGFIALIRKMNLPLPV